MGMFVGDNEDNGDYVYLYDRDEPAKKEPKKWIVPEEDVKEEKTWLIADKDD